MTRFQDQGELLKNFQEHTIVPCPACGKPGDLKKSKPFTCVHCGHIETFTSHYPLFLQINCCGNTLRANNLEHLDFLENYIRADLRERTPNINQSVISRLPQWMKSAKNRGEVPKCIGKLRKRLSEAGYRA